MRVFIVRSTPHREADRLLTVISRRRGKEIVRVPGVRWAKAKLRGHAETFRWTDLRVMSGRRYGVVVDADGEVCGDSLDASSALILVGRVMDALIPRGAVDGTLFSFLERASATIRDPQTRHPRTAALFWAVRSFAQAGHALAPHYCAECGETLPNGAAQWAAAGGFLCRSCRTSDESAVQLSSSATRVLRFLEGAGEGHAARLRLQGGLWKELSAFVCEALRGLPERAEGPEK